MLVQRLGPFLGLRSATGGDAPLNYAGDILNVRVGDGTIRPRYGYRNLAASPSQIQAVYGLARLVGYGDDYLERREWVSLERRNDTIRPYAIDPATFARTEIKDGTTSLSLNGGDWLGFGYNGSSYFVNPGNSPSLYRHDVGDATSWTALENSAYVPVGDDPAISADLQEAGTRKWVESDTYAHDAVGSHGITRNTTFAVTLDGALEVRGDDDDDGNLNRSQITVTFASAANLKYDYCAMVATASGDVVHNFDRGQKVEIQVGSTWILPDQHETLSADRKQVSVVFRMKDIAAAINVYVVRMTFAADPYSGTSGLAYTVAPLVLGGVYIGADNMADRPWDATYRKAEETYGVRYYDVAADAYTGIRGLTLDASRFGTVLVLPGGPVGDKVLLTASPNLQPPFADDITNTHYRMQFVRKDLQGVWRILGDAHNSLGTSWRDTREAWELSTLHEADPGDYVAPSSAPVFDSGGFVAGVPFKGWVVWLKQGGKANVRHSRVGDAEALASPGDDPADIGRGADFTLADDFADEPFGGVQAGDALLVPGRQGVYGQAGNYPSQMTPFRKIPGAMGCAGRFAFARYYDESGNPGIAWLDASGENVWFAAAGLVYSQDTQARPVEISAPIRGTLRRFLLTDALAYHKGLILSRARMAVDEATGSLWIVLGNRAAVLRPPSLIDGQRQWELSRYAMGRWSPYLTPFDVAGDGGGTGPGGGGGTGGEWPPPATGPGGGGGGGGTDPGGGGGTDPGDGGGGGGTDPGGGGGHVRPQCPPGYDYDLMRDFCLMKVDA